MSDIRYLAFVALRDVNVVISPPYGYSGVWETNEFAFVQVRITPTTMLRDVVAYLGVGGAAVASPVKYSGSWILCSNYHWDEIEAGETKIYIVRVKAISPGTARMRLSLCGEVVPFNCANPETGSFRMDTVYG